MEEKKIQTRKDFIELSDKTGIGTINIPGEQRPETEGIWGQSHHQRLPQVAGHGEKICVQKRATPSRPEPQNPQ